MKKILLLLAMPLVCMTTLSAQISQEQADQIVIEHLSNETKPYCVYAKEDVQTGFEVTTVTSETLELSYTAWVYYVNYAGGANGKYLIVKESNGNVLEIKAKNDEGPDNLENWRIIVEDEYPIDIPFEEYSLEGTSCQWINLNYNNGNSNLIIINSTEELINYVSCTEGSYPEIDFSKNTLLLAYGVEGYWSYYDRTTLQQISTRDYLMTVYLFTSIAPAVAYWQSPIIVSKITDGIAIELIVIKPF